MINSNMTNEDISVLAWLSSVKNFNGKLGMRFLESVGSPCDLLKLSEKTLSSLLPPAALKAFLTHKNSCTPENIIQKITAAGARFVSIYDSEYPLRLRNIPDAPLGLFVIGRLPSDEIPSVAIIGARNCSEYGRHVAEETGRYLGLHGIQVISGMAYGVDGISQMAALESDGISMAVLGSGVDVCYPPANKKLYEKLSKEGGIISTYGIGEPALASNFPPRNRIVSGLSDAVIVVEARQKSGTIITVDMALEQGREVYAVPGRITDRLSDGCNGLIGQGAEVFLSPEIFLTELLDSFENKSSVQPNDSSSVPAVSGRFNSLHRQFNGKEHLPQGLTPEAEKIYLALDLMPQNIEEICVKVNSSYAEVSLILMQLMLDNHALQVSPGCFVKISG